MGMARHQVHPHSDVTPLTLAQDGGVGPRNGNTTRCRSAEPPRPNGTLPAVKEGKPSETAISIAVNRVAASLDPVLRPLLVDPDEPYSEWFVDEHSPRAREQLAKWKSRPTVMSFWGDLMFPGGRNFILLRKRWIEDQVRIALKKGMRQVVVLGAGYDPLSLRLRAEYPRVRFFELDHPATQDVKRRALEARKALPDGVTLVPVDFARESTEERLLRAPGFRRGARALFLAEGLLMYVEPKDVDALFGLVARTARPGSRFLFSMVDSRCLADPRSPITRTVRMAGFSGEPIRSSQNPRSIKSFLSQRGFRFGSKADHRTLRTTYLDPRGITLPLGEAEFLVAADRH